MERSFARMPEKSFLFALYFVIVLLTTAVTGLVAAPLSTLFTPKQLATEVRVGGVSLGALDAEQVKSRLHLLLEAAKQKPFSLEYDGRRWTIPAKQLGITYDEEAIYQATMYASTNAQGVKKLWNKWTNETISTQIPFQFTWKPEAAANELARIKAEIDRKPVNAAFFIQGDQVHFTPHQVGRELSVEETMKRMEMALETALPERTVSLAVMETLPPITGDKLKQITTQLAQASTVLPADFKTVQKNLETLVARLDGKLIESGEVFSFNQELGPFVKGSDYLTQPVTHPLSETGGVQFGIGQAASTLYEAALRAGLQIRERHAHLQPQAYTAPGLDAAVWDEQMDLKIANSFKHPVYIDARIEQNRLAIRLFGNKQDAAKTEVRMESVESFPAETVALLDGQMPSNEQREARHGTDGVLAQVYRVTKTGRGSEGIKRVLISKDYYRPIPRLIYIGPPQQGAPIGQAGNGASNDGRPADMPLTQPQAEVQSQNPPQSSFENDPNVSSPSP